MPKGVGSGGWFRGATGGDSLTAHATQLKAPTRTKRSHPARAKPCQTVPNPAKARHIALHRNLPKRTQPPSALRLLFPHLRPAPCHFNHPQASAPFLFSSSQNEPKSNHLIIDSCQIWRLLTLSLKLHPSLG